MRRSLCVHYDSIHHIYNFYATWNVMMLRGVLIINKPKDISSFDCIRHIKGILRKDGFKLKSFRIGHAGTLDNFAQGILLVCLGREVTKKISLLMNMSKEYVVTACFGQLTDTLDNTGTILETQSVGALSLNDISRAFSDLGASYEQVPPIYSALKFHGKPLYALARNKKMTAGELEKIVEGKKRTVTLFEHEVLEVKGNMVSFRVLVSKGTYIRSLANDLAQKLSLNATTHKLVRSKIGSISLTDSCSLNSLNSIADIETNLMNIEEIIKEK